MNLASCTRTATLLALLSGILLSLPAVHAQNSAFPGQWCAQGDRNKQASITTDGMFLTLTNEAGSTSRGLSQANRNVIVAPEWQFVQGTLSPDGNRINWSNGTFWARCNSGGGSFPIISPTFRGPGIPTAITNSPAPSSRKASYLHQ